MPDMPPDHTASWLTPSPGQALRTTVPVYLEEHPMVTRSCPSPNSRCPGVPPHMEPGRHPPALAAWGAAGPPRVHKRPGRAEPRMHAMMHARNYQRTQPCTQPRAACK
jgi:hypothetical protein